MHRRAINPHMPPIGLEVEEPARQPPLTQVCRQLRAEALPGFYSGSTFFVAVVNGHSVALAPRWIESCGPYWHLIRAVELQSSSDQDYAELPRADSDGIYVETHSLLLRLRQKTRDREGLGPDEQLFDRGITIIDWKFDLWFVRVWYHEPLEKVIDNLVKKANEADMNAFWSILS